MFTKTEGILWFILGCPLIWSKYTNLLFVELLINQLLLEIAYRREDQNKISIAIVISCHLNKSTPNQSFGVRNSTVQCFLMNPIAPVEFIVQFGFFFSFVGWALLFCFLFVRAYSIIELYHSFEGLACWAFLFNIYLTIAS